MRMHMYTPTACLRPQSFVGSPSHWTALNLDPDGHLEYPTVRGLRQPILVWAKQNPVFRTKYNNTHKMPA